MFKIVQIPLAVLSSYLALFFLISISEAVYAQSSPKESNAKPKAQMATPKLKPQQELGLHLLKTAESESSALPSTMQAFVLWRASFAYTRIDPKHSDKLLRNAFMATLGIEDAPEDDRCAAPGSAGDIKSWIQQHVLSGMVHKDQMKEAEHLLPHATTSVRNTITSELVRYYVAKKQLMHGESLLSQLADSDRYPYEVAADLVNALGSDSPDRLGIFEQALSNFERHSAQTSIGNDIATFIDRTWRDVPSAVVLEAIAKILDSAKEHGSDTRYSMSSAKGSVVLNSDYALRLFQLLPILDELDKDKAETLLREQTEVADQLKMHPKGMQSLKSENENFAYGVVEGGSGIGNAAAKQQIDAETHNRLSEILKSADSDLSGALARALGLPIHATSEPWSPRSAALLGIAEKALAKQRSVSKSALDEFSKIQDQLFPEEMTGIAKVPDLYLKMQDIDGAKKAVDVLVKAGDRLYEHDTDADDPNMAFKGAWPSTDLWRMAIQQAAKISPNLPEEIIDGLQDSDIVAFERVVFATALIAGLPPDASILVADCRKNGGSFRVTSSR